MDKRVIELLDEYSLDAILVSNGCNMRYISGFAGATGYLYISRNTQVILTDFRYTIQAQTESKEFKVVEISSGYSDAVNQLIEQEKVERLGFEAEDMLYRVYADFQKKLKVKEFVQVGNELSRLRMVKTQEELAYIEKAESIVDIAFSKILEIIKPGMTELEIAANLEFIMKTNGGQGLSFDTIVASGVNSSMPHAVPSHKKVEKGDFITMDYGCMYHGYCADFTRTIVVGKASEKQKQIYKTVLEAQLAALDSIKAGKKGSEIDKIARDIINRAGYEGCFGHGLGHSVGLFIHEEPRLSLKDDTILLPNMTETVEPGIYIKDFGGVRIEDLVVVTEEGHINFTHSDKQLIEL